MILSFIHVTRHITKAAALFFCRTAVKAVVERLTQNAFYTSARALFERDRSLFAVLCALEVKQVRGNNFTDTSRKITSPLIVTKFR